MNWNQLVRDCLATGLTQTQLADKAAVSQFTISQLNTGKQKSVEWATGQRLLTAYNEITGKVDC